MPALAQPQKTLARHIEDRRQLAVQPVCEPMILATEEGFGEQQHDHAAGKGSRRIGDARQLVGEDDEARRQPAGPGEHMLAIDCDRIFAADREQPFGNGGLVGACAKPGVGDDGERFADQRLQAEIAAETGERRRDHIVRADQPGEDLGNRAFAGAARPDDQENLLLPGVGREAIAEPVRERIN